MVWFRSEYMTTTKTASNHYTNSRKWFNEPPANQMESFCLSLAKAKPTQTHTQTYSDVFSISGWLLIFSKYWFDDLFFCCILICHSLIYKCRTVFWSPVENIEMLFFLAFYGSFFFGFALSILQILLQFCKTVLNLANRVGFFCIVCSCFTACAQ